MPYQRRIWNNPLEVHTVFFAARPDPTTAKRIAGMAQDVVRHRRLPAKPLSPERLHVSLLAVDAFDGGCPPAILDNVREMAKTVSMTPFTVTFDHVASFGGAMGRRALVLTGGEGAAGFVTFQKTLSLAIARGGLVKRGLGVRHKTSFIPHVTMMYTDQVCNTFAIEPISWTVDEFFLIDSLYGQSKHELLGRWPLMRTMRI